MKINIESDWYILTEKCSLVINKMIVYHTNQYRTKQNVEDIKQAKKFSKMARDPFIFSSKENMINIINEYTLVNYA